MKYVLFDCDNTAGLPGKPMDDALALLYLLGKPAHAKVLGVSCTFANGTATEVYGATKQLMEEVGYDIPVLPGAEPGEDPRSEAARFLAKTVNDHPGEISLVAIGSLTNLYGAWLLDSHFFEKVKEIVLMGGYTAPVFYHTRHLEELNFSMNPKAAQCVLNHGHNISILTGNNTLIPSYLPGTEFLEKLAQCDPYIPEKCGYRFADKARLDGDSASYCWDVVASVYLLHPELFADRVVSCYVTENMMHSGWLGITEEAKDTCRLNLPEVKDLTAYRQEMYAGWQAFRRRAEA